MSNLLIISKKLPELEKFKAQYPMIVSKLQFWAAKRLNSRYGFNDFVSDNFVAREVDQYLEAIAFSTDANDLLVNVRRFQNLSLQEKSIIGKLFPFKLPNNRDRRELDWFCQSHWYKLGDGQYTTALEEVLNGITYKGKDVAIITKNMYEADILNAPNMMIVDVDLDSDTYNPVIYSEAFALKILQAFIETYDSKLGFRAYRTGAGLRYICTSQEFDPMSTESDHIMANLFADDRYRALCRFQSTYRARLTPKPWRAWRDPDASVCRLVGVFGKTDILQQFKAPIRYHDKVTGVSKQNLVLA